ncbi:MAG: GDP-L-fucose synthase [Alphaproteobacteria bacterium]
MDASARVFVAGHRGMVGSAVSRALRAAGYTDILERSRAELDLTDRGSVDAFLAAEKPDAVIDAAAKVGGIVANDIYSGDFIRENLLIQTNLIDAAYRHGVKKFVFLGSTCIYPKHCEQPMREDALLSGSLEPTNEAYAVAKIAGIVMCRSYAKQFGFNAVSLLPTNLYGPGDNFDLETSHVIPALMRKAHEAKVSGAKSMQVWGSGEPTREFLHVDDLADAIRFVLENVDESDDDLLNVGSGQEITIGDLVRTICDVVGYDGLLDFDRSKPDGTPRKLSDPSKLAARGWRASTSLRDGLASVYDWFRQNHAG